jgi:uridine phosphorylase
VFKELQRAGIEAIRGVTWTTDAPFRETRSALDAAAAEGLKAVEMEVAGLYAFARARGKPVVCFALVTNQMAQVEGDFEKGVDDGAEHALSLVAAAYRGWRALRTESDTGTSIRETL